MVQLPDTRNINLRGTVTLVAGWRVGTKISIGRLEITRTIADHFRMICEAHLDALSEKVPRPYWPDTDLEPSEEYLYMDLSAMDSESPVLIAHRSIHLADPITPTSLPTRSLLFYSIVFSTGPMFLRKVNSYQSLSSGKKFMRLQDTLTEIDDPVFAFDDRIDLVLNDYQIIISNVTAFEQLFRDELALTAHIGHYAAVLASQVALTPQSRMTLMAECARRVRLRRRLEAIYQSGHLNGVLVSTISHVAMTHGLAVSAIVKNGQVDINPSNVDDVLKLLNDDFFVGDLSLDQFVADKKMRR